GLHRQTVMRGLPGLVLARVAAGAGRRTDVRRRGVGPECAHRPERETDDGRGSEDRQTDVCPVVAGDVRSVPRHPALRLWTGRRGMARGRRLPVSPYSRELSGATRTLSVKGVSARQPGSSIDAITRMTPSRWSSQNTSTST